MLSIARQQKTANNQWVTAYFFAVLKQGSKQAGQSCRFFRFLGVFFLCRLAEALISGGGGPRFRFAPPGVTHGGSSPSLLFAGRLVMFPGAAMDGMNACCFSLKGQNIPAWACACSATPGKLDSFSRPASTGNIRNRLASYRSGRKSDHPTPRLLQPCCQSKTSLPKALRNSIRIADWPQNQRSLEKCQ